MVSDLCKVTAGAERSWQVVIFELIASTLLDVVLGAILVTFRSLA